MKRLTEYLPDEHLTQLRRLRRWLASCGVPAILVTDEATNLHALMEPDDAAQVRAEALPPAEDHLPHLRRGALADLPDAAEVSRVPPQDPELVRRGPDRPGNPTAAGGRRQVPP